MLFKKKSYDEYGYALKDIIWGNISLDGSIYHLQWHFVVSFIEKDTKKEIAINLADFMTKQELHQPRKLKKELLNSMNGKNVVECLEFLIQRFPESEKYVLSKLPANLSDEIGVSCAVGSAGL